MLSDAGSTPAASTKPIGHPRGFSSLPDLQPLYTPMKFRRILETLVRSFGERTIDFAVIGALALQAHGYARATQDIDFVVRAEHLIAMKVFAMSNDPDRAFREMGDLHYHMNLPGIDDREVKAYFARHGQLDRYRELKPAKD
jgi:hypothetical protein